MKLAAEIFRQATPGTHEIPMQVAEGDLVVSYIVGIGRHEGELLGWKEYVARISELLVSFEPSTPEPVDSAASAPV